MRATTKITLDGNFFKRDPGKTIRSNIKDMLDALAAVGERLVADDITSHAGSMPGYTGWSRANVVGRTESYAGKRWGLHAVISANTDGMSAGDAIRTKAAAATIERRWHPFRRVASGMNRSRAVVGANLVKGLD